jgi:hypothetical protein
MVVGHNAHRVKLKAERVKLVLLSVFIDKNVYPAHSDEGGYVTIYLFAIDYTDSEDQRWLAIVAAVNEDQATQLLTLYHRAHQKPAPISHQFVCIEQDFPLTAIGYALTDSKPKVVLVRKVQS